MCGCVCATVVCESQRVGSEVVAFLLPTWLPGLVLPLPVLSCLTASLSLLFGSVIPVLDVYPKSRIITHIHAP